MSFAHRSRSLLLATAVMFSTGVTTAFAGSYTFTNIVSTSSMHSYFPYSPILNNNGLVGFATQNDNDEATLYTWDAGGITTLAKEGEYGVGQFKVHAAEASPIGSINDAGVISFIVSSEDSYEGIYKVGGGGGLSLVVNNTGGFESFGDILSMNNNGRVAFFGNLDDEPYQGIYSRSGSSTTTYTGASKNLYADNFVQAVSVNDSGVVAFWASTDMYGGGELELVATDGSTVETIASIGTDVFGYGYMDAYLSINESGTVAFSAILPSFDYAIMTGDGDSLSTVVDTTGPFEWLDGLSFNDNGIVAFEAGENYGESGIFIGPDPTTDKVVGFGDTLFGGTVLEVSMGVEALNNDGEIVFLYELEDGTEGIALATPESNPGVPDPPDPPVVPEPSTLALMMLGMISIGSYCVRKRRNLIRR